MANRVISAVLTFRDENFSSGLRRANSQAGDFGRQMNSVQNRVENFKASATNAFKAVGAASVALGATAIAGLAVAVAKTTMEMDDSFAKLQAQTGAMGTDLTALKGAAKDTFTRGYGESLSEVTEAVARVKQNMKGLDNGEIANVTSNAILLSKTFDSDVNEVTRGVNNTMKAFGVSSTQAFDLFTAGGQRGLNFSNEMFDNVAEYAPLFGEMGYSAEEYFGILERGSQAGVYNLDYVNDVMKEFQIRSKDGSKATSDAMGQLSQSTQSVWKEFLNGKGTVSDVASTVVSELKGMDNQVEAGKIAVSLFGTKWEDLEADAMYAMLGTTEAMKGFEGATESAASKVENTFSNRMTQAWRDLQVSISEVVQSEGAKEFFDTIATKAEELVPKITNMAEKAIEFGNTIEDNWGPIKETVIGITTAILAFKLGMMGLSVVSTITGIITSFRTALITGTAAQWAMNIAMSANPAGLVVAAFAGLVTAGVLLYRNWDKVKAKWDTVWTSIKQGAASGVNFVIDKLNGLINVINKIPGVNIPIIPKVEWGNVKQSRDVINKTSVGGRIPEYAVGSDRITHDQYAMIHKDEMIIPARQAQRVRQAGGNIDNIDKLINKPSSVSVTNTDSNNTGSVPIQVTIQNINAGGVTVAEVAGNIVAELKLAMSNM